MAQKVRGRAAACNVGGAGGWRHSDYNRHNEAGATAETRTSTDLEGFVGDPGLRSAVENGIPRNAWGDLCDRIIRYGGPDFERVADEVQDALFEMCDLLQGTLQTHIPAKRKDTARQWTAAPPGATRKGWYRMPTRQTAPCLPE